MPNRILRDWTNSDRIDSLSCQAEVFFTRLIMKADDFGCFWADTRLLKANLYPLKLDKIREADMSRWIAECVKAGLIVLYEANQKKYLQIQDFRQRLDKAKAKFPLPTENQVRGDSVDVDIEFPAESEARNESETKPKRPKGLVGDADDTQRRKVLKKQYQDIVKSLEGKERKEIWTGLKDFVNSHKPDFPEPYVDVWNLFAVTYRLSLVELISDGRRKKFGTRISESGFDFIRIMEKIKTSPHLKGDNNRSWKVTFDWVIENDKNYLKIMEGQYD
jgi:hypothetical protein